MDLKLYEIDSAIEELTDLLVDENGEINPVVEAEINQLEIDRERKIANIGLTVKNLNSWVEGLKVEEANLRAKRKTAERQIEWFKNYLNSVLQGEKVKTPTLTIGYRKSESVEIDPFCDLALINKNHPDLVSIEYKPSKSAIKEYIKQTGISFEGITIKEKTNIQIK